MRPGCTGTGRTHAPAPNVSTGRPARDPAIVLPVGADPVTFVIAVVIAAAISLGVFAHADRHGSRHATAWGIAAFLAAGIAVPLYFIRYWARRRRSP